MSVQADINYNVMTYLIEPRPRQEKNRSRNSPEHELVKALCVWLLQKRGYVVYTEATFFGGGVCDIFIPEIPAYVEVCKTETPQILKEKCKRYPKKLTQIVIYVEDILSGMKYEYSDCPHFIGDASCGFNPDIIPEEYCADCPMTKNPTPKDMIDRLEKALPGRE